MKQEVIDSYNNKILDLRSKLEDSVNKNDMKKIIKYSKCFMTLKKQFERELKKYED